MELADSGIRDLFGNSLAFEDNFHLFLWEGDLVARADPPSRDQEAWDVISLEDWDYHFQGNSQVLPESYVDLEEEETEPQPLPEIDIEKVRQKIKTPPWKAYPDPSPFRPDPIRGNSAQQFEAWQTRNRELAFSKEVPNDYAKYLPKEDDVEVPDEAKKRGAQWIINHLVGERVITDWLAQTLPLNGLREFFQLYPDAVEAKQGFLDYRLDDWEYQFTYKRQKALEAIEKYRYYGSLPIADNEGVRDLLTLCNVATAKVLIEALLGAIGRYQGNLQGIKYVTQDFQN